MKLTPAQVVERIKETRKLTEHWAMTGWHGGHVITGSHAGRGWHDAGSPSKLP